MTAGVGPAVTVVGLLGGHAFGPDARRALAAAEIVVGSERQFRLVAGSVPDAAERIGLTGPLDGLFDVIDDRRRDGHDVTVLASGDPGFFGIVRSLGLRFGSDALVVHPAPSSVAMAFARVGLSWDDAAVVSAHGRSPVEAAATLAEALATNGKVAVLTAPETPPEWVGAAVRKLTPPGDVDVTVVSRIGETDEAIERVDVDGLADGAFDPMSIVVLVRSDHDAGHDGPTLRWGRSETDFDHRDGMITKAEARAVAIGKLALPRRGVMWDVGSGSGSVAVECALLCPGLHVIAVDRDAGQVQRTRTNAVNHHAHLEVVEGSAPGVLVGLPDPDRVFIGGGGIEVLDAVLARLSPAGTVVATYAVVERAVQARERLGNLVQVGVSRGVPISDLGFRLVPENPIFICWGPDGNERKGPT